MSDLSAYLVFLSAVKQRLSLSLSLSLSLLPFPYDSKPQKRIIKMGLYYYTAGSRGLASSDFSRSTKILLLEGHLSSYPGRTGERAGGIVLVPAK